MKTMLGLSRIEESRKLQAGLLVAIIAVGTILRFYKLGAWSFWIDEIFTLNRAAQHVNLETILAQWWHPSISLILTARAVETFGASEWSARLVPALIGIITIPIIFIVVRRLFGPVLALITALLLAVSPWHLEWSQNARFYSAMLLFYFLAACTFYMAIEKDRPLYLLLSGVLLVLAIGERFIAAVFVPVVLVYLLLLIILPVEKPGGLRARNIALIVVPGVVFGIIEVVRFLATGSSYLIGAVDLIYTKPIDDPFRLATFIAFDIGVPILCLGFFAGIHLLSRRSRIGLYIFINALVPIGLVLLVSPFYFTQDRYAFMALPFWLILAAFALYGLLQHVSAGGRLFAIGVLALLVAHAAGDNLIYFHVNHGNRHEWKTAFELARAESQPDDQYVSWWTQFGPYYLDEEIISWETIDPQFVRSAGTRFWFILDEDTIWGNEVMKPWIERNARLVDILYLRRPNMDHLYIYLYEPEA